MRWDTGEGLGDAQGQRISKRRGENEREGQGPGLSGDPKELIGDHMHFTAGPARLPTQSLGMTSAPGKQRRGTSFAQGQLFPIIWGWERGLIPSPLGNRAQCTEAWRLFLLVTIAGISPWLWSHLYFPEPSPTQGPFHFSPNYAVIS